PAFGYTVSEKRTKLKPEFAELPQEKLRELKERGTEITRSFEIPLIAYSGDTAPGPHLVREDVRKAQILITECTFLEADHKERARIGMHMHIDSLAEWLRVVESQYVVLVHISRRTDMAAARKRISQVAGEKLAQKVLFLMDYKGNRERYEKQLAEAEAKEGKKPVPAGTPAAPPGPSDDEGEET
ncbi:MAG: hypothetical protein JNK25_11455, partial [Phycisphaerae bacterium]|nr:hypothetical protein [Phycisphaerae bacterium]